MDLSEVELAEIDPAALRIVTWPDPALMRRAAPVAEPDVPAAGRIAARMIELMHEASGVGLAAPQVGLSVRLFVANWTQEPGDDHVFINPTLRDPSRKSESAEEGCLSLPELRIEVRRPAGIEIEALDAAGEPVTLQSDGFAARVWQHEFDHLDGVLITDRMGAVDRLANRSALRALGMA